MSNSTSLLHNVYLFKELSQKELEQLSHVAKQESFTSGDIIFTQGDAATSMYVIKFGSVKIHRNEELNVAMLGTGSHFGEMAFIDGENRSATAVAVENCEILRLDYSVIRTFMTSHPEISTKIYKALATFLCSRLRVTTVDLTFAREKNLRHF